MIEEFELKPPILVRPISKQQVTIGSVFRLNLSDYVENSLSPSDNDEGLSAGMLYSVGLDNDDPLPPGLDYTITGQIYGQLGREALANSPYLMSVSVSNGAIEPLEISFELEVLPALRPEEEYSIDQALKEEFADQLILTAEEERELFNTLKEQEEKIIGQFTEERQAMWQAVLDGQSIPEIESLLNRSVTHQEVYYLLARMAYFVIWDASNPAPAGKLYPLSLIATDKHFHIYDRGSCLVATPKHLFDHNRTLLHAVKVAQAMAHEVFKRGWTVEFGGFDKMVRAAWIELELLAQKHEKPVRYSYFNPSPHDLDTLNQAKSIRL